MSIESEGNEMIYTHCKSTSTVECITLRREYSIKNKYNETYSQAITFCIRHLSYGRIIVLLQKGLVSYHLFSLHFILVGVGASLGNFDMMLTNHLMR